MGFLVRWAVTFAAVVVAGYLAQLLPAPWQFLTYQGIQSAAIFALILGLVNAVIRPVVALLALPLTCLTLGLFSLVINGLMFLLAEWLTTLLRAPGVDVAGFFGAIVAAIVVGLVSGILNRFVEA